PILPTARRCSRSSLSVIQSAKARSKRESRSASYPGGVFGFPSLAAGSRIMTTTMVAAGSTTAAAGRCSRNRTCRGCSNGCERSAELPSKRSTNMGSILKRGNKLYAKIKAVDGTWKQLATGFNVGEEVHARKWVADHERRVALARAELDPNVKPMTVRRYVLA